MNTTNGAKMKFSIGPSGNAATIAMREETVASANAKSESLMREVRQYLEYARQVFPVNVELADAFGAKACNKLAMVVGMQR